MNGIIHNCTHNDSDSVTKRVSEDQMFIAIFNYIEHLFGKIKPKKLFFMAIDVCIRTGDMTLDDTVNSSREWHRAQK